MLDLNTNLNEHFEHFLEMGKTERGYLPTTIGTWGANLRAYGSWLNSEGEDAPSLHHFNRERAKAYLAAVKARKLRPRTVKGLIAPLRVFGDWCIEVGTLTDNPFDNLALPKLDIAERKTVSDKEVKAILDACSRQRDPR